MKRMMRTLMNALGLSAMLAAATAAAVPITYEGTLASPRSTVTGTIGGFGLLDEDATEVDFWSFVGVAGNTVTIAVSRVVSDLDPAMDLYFGTTAVDSLLFRAAQSWGGLRYLISADDEVDVPGPFGDPLISSFKLPSTGAYTLIVGGSVSTAAGPYPYRLAFALVPEPATALLLFAGLFVIGGGLHERRRRA